MSDVLDQIVTEFLGARAVAVQSATFARDQSVMEELRALLEEVERAGGGVTSLTTRQESRPRSPWDGPLTDLDVDLMRAAVTSALVSPRLGTRGAGGNTLKEVEVVLRQLGRWLCRRRSLGLNALTLGYQLTACPAPFTWAAPQRAPTPTARPTLRLVQDRASDGGGLAAAGS